MSTTTQPTADDLLAFMRRSPNSEAGRAALASAFKVSPQTISDRMDLLIASGAVKRRIHGNAHIYMLTDPQMQVLNLVPARHVPIWTKPMSVNAADRRRMGAA